MNKCFCKNDLRTGEVTQPKVTWWIFSNLLPEPTLILQEMMIYPRANHLKGIVHVSQCKKGFALYICFRNIDWIKSRRIVVEDSE